MTMARKPKTSAVSSADILKAMYPDLPTSEDYTDPLAAATKTAEKQPQETGQLTELQRQVQALQSQVTQTQRTNQALMNQATRDLPPQAPQLDPSKAPDPAIDPVAYTQYLLDANDRKLQYEKDLYAWQTRQQNETANKTAALWDGFSASYPELAKDSKRVELATLEVINRARSQNRDVDKYMYGASDQFMADVAAEIGKLWPTAKGSDDDDGDDYEEGSTDMLGGGAGGQSAASARANARPPEQYGALSKEVMTWQQATGFHG